MMGTRRQNANGLFEVIAQLQGLDIPTVCWERDILPLRVENYRKEWLDELSLSGEVSWGRLHPPARDPEKSRPTASLTRIAPISLFLREDREWLLETAGEARLEDLSSPACQVVQLLEANGAMFSSDLQTAAGLLPSQLDDVLGELVARGFITADGFSGLRNLVRESTTGDSSVAAAPAMAKLIRKRRSSQSVGRWSLWRKSGERPRVLPQPTVEHWAWQLLRRWGVVYRDLLDRESGAPRWWELVRVFRRMEARGEIRGGRFIRGVAGEQYCTAETVAACGSCAPMKRGRRRSCFRQRIAQPGGDHHERSQDSGAGGESGGLCQRSPRGGLAGGANHVACRLHGRTAAEDPGTAAQQRRTETADERGGDAGPGGCGHPREHALPAPAPRTDVLSPARNRSPLRSMACPGGEEAAYPHSEVAAASAAGRAVSTVLKLACLPVAAGIATFGCGRARPCRPGQR